MGDVRIEQPQRARTYLKDIPCSAAVPSHKSVDFVAILVHESLYCPGLVRVIF
jgi:hypothetical protein